MSDGMRDRARRRWPASQIYARHSCRRSKKRKKEDVDRCRRRSTHATGGLFAGSRRAKVAGHRNHPPQTTAAPTSSLPSCRRGEEPAT
nr:hypothetical protein Iba_scaffold185897CG0010 [Ipomoea batatas]GME02268.1 hypothetical protein Iba_contig4312CG0010 [Ipomoea batatas]